MGVAIKRKTGQGTSLGWRSGGVSVWDMWTLRSEGILSGERSVCDRWYLKR